MNENLSSPVSPTRRLFQIGMRVGVIGVLVWGMLAGLDVLFEALEMLDDDMATFTRALLIFVILLVYAFVLAVPFAPGVEIGVAVLVISGPTAAPFVYLATVIGLLCAFVAGQFTSLRWLHETALDLRLRRLARWFRRIEETPPSERLDEMERKLPKWLAVIVCRWRYFGVAFLVNIPGNFALGGGGGILMMAGLSRLFELRWMFVTVAIAVMPVPLAFWSLGAFPALPFWQE